MEPAAVVAGTVPAGTPSRFELEVTTQIGGLLAELTVSDVPEGITVEVPPLGKPAASLRLQGTLMPGVAKPHETISLNARFADGRHVTRKVPIKHDVHRELQLFPPKAFAIVPSPGAVVEVKVLARGEEALLRRLKPSVNIDGSEVEIRESPMGRQIIARIPSEKALGVTTPTLTISGASHPYTVPITLSAAK